MLQSRHASIRKQVGDQEIRGAISELLRRPTLRLVEVQPVLTEERRDRWSPHSSAPSKQGEEAQV